MDYSNRLLALGIFTLEDKRKRGDLIQLLKIENEFNRVAFLKPNRSAPALDLTNIFLIYLKTSTRGVKLFLKVNNIDNRTLKRVPLSINMEKDFKKKNVKLLMAYNQLETKVI
jgi:hypothetical protein